MNPICKIPNYRTEICKVFSSVKTLDGIKKEYDAFGLKDDIFSVDFGKLNPENFEFDFKKKIDLNMDSKDENNKTFFASKAKSEIRIMEFHKEIEELTKQVKNM